MDYLPKSIYQIKALKKALTASSKSKPKGDFTFPMPPGGIRQVYQDYV